MQTYCSGCRKVLNIGSKEEDMTLFLRCRTYTGNIGPKK